MKKIIIASILSIVALPGLVSAATSTAPVSVGCIVLPQTLSLNMRDSGANGNIYQYQQFLVSQGYTYIKPSGNFDWDTYRTTGDFQLKNGLNYVGSVGPLTRQLIQKMTCENFVVPTPILGCAPNFVFNSMKGKLCTSTTTSTNSSFTISTSTQPSIKILNPTTGMTFTQNQANTISWQAIKSNPSSANYILGYNSPLYGGKNAIISLTASQAHCDAADKCYYSWTPNFVASNVVISVYETTTGLSDTSGPITISAITTPTPVLSSEHATIDSNVFSTVYTGTPTVSGSASGVSQIGVVLSNNGGKAYGSGTVNVVNGRWSVVVSPAISGGLYTVYVYDTNNNINEHDHRNPA